MFIQSVYGLPGRLSGKVSSSGGRNGNPLHILAWETPWTKEPGRLQSMGLQSRTGLSRWTVPFSCSGVSNSLWPHGLQHARHPCPSLPMSSWTTIFTPSEAELYSEERSTSEKPVVYMSLRQSKYLYKIHQKNSLKILWHVIFWKFYTYNIHKVGAKT